MTPSGERWDRPEAARIEALPRLHVVTDDEVLSRTDFGSVAEALLRVGGRSLALHVRGPHATGAAVYHRVLALASTASACGATLIVNDRIDVALAAGAHGVHLGRRSLEAAAVRALVGEGAMVGCSAHDAAQVRSAVGGGADYVMFGNVYGTPSHPDRPGSGEAALARVVREAAPAPVIAIGGIDPPRSAAVRAAGAHGAAAVRGVWEAPDPIGAVKAYISALEG